MCRESLGWCSSPVDKFELEKKDGGLVGMSSKVNETAT